MITLYRRHEADCKVHTITLRGKKTLTPEQKKKYLDCDCAIWMNGTGEHAKNPGRKSTGTSDMKVAIAMMQEKDARSKDQAVYGKLLADAVTEFLARSANRIKGSQGGSFSSLARWN